MLEERYRLAKSPPTDLLFSRQVGLASQRMPHLPTLSDNSILDPARYDFGHFRTPQGHLLFTGLSCARLCHRSCQR
jgi:hypothetical protein